LLAATPDANVPAAQARELMQRLLDNLAPLLPPLDDSARRRGAELLDAHRRVRTAARHTSQVTVEPQLPPDLLGVYLLLPVL
jgi:hypothetical protein